MAAAQIKLTLVGSPHGDLTDLLRASGFNPVIAASTELAALAKPSAVQPDVVVLDMRQSAGVPAAVSDLTRRHPTTGVVLVAAKLDPALMLEALHAGAKGFVAAPLSAQELTAAIARVTQQPTAAQAGRVVAFVGAKGGVGTTTLAVNVATAMARMAANRTLLIDLNLKYGDAAAHLAAEPRFTVLDAFENAHRLDEAFIRGLVVRTAAGVDLLAAADRAAATPIDADRLRALLDFSRKHFTYTVVDVPRTDGVMLDGLDAAATIVVVVSQELTAVRSAGRLLGMLRQRYGADHVQVALGRSDAQAEIGTDDLARVLGGPVRAFSSDYRRALEALNSGKPLVLENHCRLAGEVTRFVRDLTGSAAQKPEAERPSILSKWFRGGTS
jgi:pilus assembly protein CpaE